MAPSLEEPALSPSISYNNHLQTTHTNSHPAEENPTTTDKMAHNASHASFPAVKQPHPETEYQHIWFITGPAGCGKSTVAQSIATALRLPFLEGDNFHPQANITKMAQGHPLTDADRWDWLIALRTAATRTLAGLPTHAPSPNAGGNGSPPPPHTRAAANSRDSTRADAHTASCCKQEPLPSGVVLTCSALKLKYRDVLRMPAYTNPRDDGAWRVRVHFVYLHATEDVLLERVRMRKGHYMGVEMVRSQLESLEVPRAEEWDVLTVVVGGTKQKVEADALRAVRGRSEAPSEGTSSKTTNP